MQPGVEMTPPVRRQVVGAGALVAQCPHDEHEARRGPHQRDLPGGGDADDELRAGGSQLFSHQYREGRPHRHADDSDLDTVEVHGPHLGVVASPSGMAPSTTGGGQVADDVTVGIEQAHPRYRLSAGRHCRRQPSAHRSITATCVSDRGETYAAVG